MAGWILPYPRLCLFDRLSHFCKPRNSRHRRKSPIECHWARLKNTGEKNATTERDFRVQHSHRLEVAKLAPAVLLANWIDVL
jgi:hypothetical protein